MKDWVLKGNWELAAVESFNKGNYTSVKDWITQKFPIQWQQTQELSEHTGKVVYRKHFTIEDLSPSCRYFLKVSGIFYFWHIYLNGEYIGDGEGYFSTRYYGITDFLKKENELIIEVFCPQEEYKNYKEMITGVFSHWDCSDSQKNPGGIWQDIQILETGEIFIQSVILSTLEIINEQKVRVKACFNFNVIRTQDANLIIRFIPNNFEGAPIIIEKQHYLEAGYSSNSIEFEVENIKLWWSLGLGLPSLYKVELGFFQDINQEVSNEVSFLYGFRTIEVRDYIFYLNQRKVFIRGTNMGPGDYYLANYHSQMVSKDLDLAIEANINMIRLHGHISHPDLYDAADRLGLLLWQDFPLQWGYRRDILDTMEIAVEEMVNRLTNHPSIALWSIHNEPFAYTSYKKRNAFLWIKTLFQYFVYSPYYYQMDKKLKQRVETIDKTRFCNPASGVFGLPWKKGTDTHLYFGWYYQNLSSLDTFIKRFYKNCRFISEFGAQSFPNEETTYELIPDEEKPIPWNILTDRHCLQKDRMEKYNLIEDKESLKEWIESSQAYQSYLNDYYIDRLRLLKYQPCGGILSFMFVDYYSAITWSVLDGYRRPKKAYLRLKTAFHPIGVIALIPHKKTRVGEDILIPIYIVNDTQTAYYNAVLDIQWFSIEGILVKNDKYIVNMEADSLPEKIGELNIRLSDKGRYQLKLTIIYQNAHLIERKYLIDNSH